MDLHFLSLVLAMILVMVQSAFALFFLAHGHRREPSLLHAGLAVGIMGAGAVLNQLLRGRLSPVMVVGLGNAFLFYGALHLWQAVRMFYGRRPWFRPALAAALGVLFAFLFLPAFKEDAKARGVAASLLYGATAFGLAWEFTRANREEVWAGPRWLSAFAFGTFGAASLLRAFLLHRAPPGVSPVSLVLPNTILLIAAIFMMGFIGLGFSMVLAQKLEARQSRLAQTDLLTELLNRRGYETFSQRVLNRAKVRGEGATVVLIDVDHFKRINDTYGHAAGDLVLESLGAYLRRQLRERDGAGRLGGEELSVLLPETRAVDAVPIAERLRAGIEALELHWEGTRIPVTASLGVATTGEAGYELKALLQLADERLYEAKQGGRNRVIGPGT